MASIPPITDTEDERRIKRAEDVAYTINHAISCGTTDMFIQPYAGAWAANHLPDKLRWVNKIFESHEHHHHGEGCGHDHAPTATAAEPSPFVATSRPFGQHTHDANCGHMHSRMPSFGAAAEPHAQAAPEPHIHVASAPGKQKAPSVKHNVAHWFGAEIIGDVGGILPTIAVQRLFPGFMNGIRHLLEPLMGGLFKSGATRDANRWAAKHGFAPDSPETLERAGKLYEHEMSHLPQAVMWNVFSIPINIGYLLLTTKGLKPSLSSIVMGKTFATVTSNTLLVGGRAIAPQLFNSWDGMNSKYVIAPVSKAVGQLFGVDKKTSDEVARRQQDTLEWTARLQAAPETARAK